MKWPHVRIGDVCDLNPRLPKTHTLNDDDAVSFVPMAAVSELSGTIQTRSTRRFAEVRKGYTPFQNNDVLFAKITPCMENGKAAIARDLVHGYGFGSTEFHVLRAGEIVLPEWLHFFVRQATFRHEAKRNFTGTGGQQRVPATFVANTLIPLPPLPEQRRIVDLLTRAEGIVRLRREAAAKAAELIPAIFIDMFGDPVRNPKAWPIVPLGSVATVQGGLQVTRARLSHPLERPYLRVANVYRDRLDLVEIKSIRLTEAELNRTRLQIGDLLFVEGHGNPQEVGRVAVWDGSIQDCTHQNHLIRARPNNDQLMPEFACVQLNTPAGRQSLLRAGKTTSGLSTISAQNVKDAEVMLPRMALQRDFVKLAEEAQSIATLQTEAQLKAQATFNAWLAQAFAPHGSL